MKRSLVYKLIILLILSVFDVPFAQQKKVYLFPLVSSEKDLNIAEEYSRLLKEKLIKSEAMKIVPVEKFNSVLSIENINTNFIKSYVQEYFKRKKLTSALFGYIIKKKNVINVKIILCDIQNDHVINRFEDRIYSENGITRSSTNCAVEIIDTYYGIKGIRYFFSSLIMPGMGQLMMKKYVKGSLFLTCTWFLIYKYSTSGSQKSIKNDAKIMVTGKGRNKKYVYLFKGREVSYSFLEAKRDEYYDYNKKLVKRKKMFQLAAVTVYLINVVDVLFSVKEYNDRRGIKNKITISTNIFDDHPEICLQYRF